MKIRLTNIDGSYPNLALMKLSHWYKNNGDYVYFTRGTSKSLLEEDYDVVYGSCIFLHSKEKLDIFLSNFPNAIIGGTGTNSKNVVEDITGEYEHYDYSIYPDFEYSIGFTQRGCRLNCSFCVVPKKERRPRSVNAIYDIYREGKPKNILLLDNDFFGQPKEQWLERIKEIKEGKFKVCFNQGVNIRLMDEEIAYNLSQVYYSDKNFKHKCLYTAWDNLRDEDSFFKGVDILEKAGIPPKHLRVYKLLGYDQKETWKQIFYRFYRMVDRKIPPYPMVYDIRNKELRMFQRWVILGWYRKRKWGDLLKNQRTKFDKTQIELF